jgi:hypothetical protein
MDTKGPYVRFLGAAGVLEGFKEGCLEGRGTQSSLTVSAVIPPKRTLIPLMSPLTLTAGGYFRDSR